MGYTGYFPKYYYANGTAHRKKEVDEQINCEDFQIVRSSMVGSVYYGAVRIVKTGEIFGVVAPTHVRKNEFMYKLIEDNEGPCYYNCPISILRCLTDTKSEYALRWREICYNNYQKKRGKK